MLLKAIKTFVKRDFKFEFFCTKDKNQEKEIFRLIQTSLLDNFSMPQFHDSAIDLANQQLRDLAFFNHSQPSFQKA